MRIGSYKLELEKRVALSGWEAASISLIAILFALAFFSKQSSLSAAAACFLSLFLEGRRRKSLAFFGLFLLLVGVGLAGCRAVYGRDYFLNAYSYVATAPISLHRSIKHVSVAVVLYIVPLAAWVYLAFRAFRDRGLALIDPHGDLAEEILEFIPKRRINDVIYFNPAD